MAMDDLALVTEISEVELPRLFLLLEYQGPDLPEVSHNLLMGESWADILSCRVVLVWDRACSPIAVVRFGNC